MFNTATGAVSTLAGSGNRAVPRDGSAAQAMFRTPAGMVWASNGNASVLYVADDTAVRVVRARATPALLRIRSFISGPLAELRLLRCRCLTAG